VIQNGRYKTSKARGLTKDQNTNGSNLKSFESGLQTISQKQFATDDYIFQEGQYLKKTTAQNWLDRKSKSNASGLNPEDNGQTDADKRNPDYLQAIEEQDYMTQDGNNLKLGGMTIGLAMNQVDYYQKEEYGATYETKISHDKMVSEGKSMADQVVSRMRKTEGVGNVPIVIALYEQATNDSLVGGTFFAYGISKDGGKTINEWHDVNEANYVLPVVGSAKSGNSSDADSFTNFKNNVQSFFPNLSGVTAQTHYKDGNLSGMNITINTQFYSETEIKSFTQYLVTAANKYLPSEAAIEITVQSTDGTQAFVARKAGEKSFYSHVFGSY
jgi:protein involved in sex pheromone biosynthesis